MFFTEYLKINDMELYDVLNAYKTCTIVTSLTDMYKIIKRCNITQPLNSAIKTIFDANSILSQGQRIVLSNIDLTKILDLIAQNKISTNEVIVEEYYMNVKRQHMELTISLKK